jgi:hypothetical protein
MPLPDPRAEPDLLNLVRWALAKNALDDFGRELVAYWEAGLLSSSELWREIGEDLRLRREELRLHDAPPFTLPEGLDQGALWGNDAAGNVIWLPDSFADAHVLVVGASGSGKTGLILFWGEQWPSAASSSSV